MGPIPATSGPTHAMAVRLAVLAILVIYSRLNEQIANALGFSPYLVLILSGTAFILMALTGGLARSLLSKPGIFLTLFSGWLMFVTLFSVWKGGSVSLLRDYWSKAYILYLILAGLIVSADQCRKMLYALGGAAIIVEISMLLERGSLQGRLEAGLGSFANPNELAFYLAFSLPGCVLLILNSRPFGFLRAVGLISSALLCLLVFRTGSRMGLIMILVALLFLLLTLSLADKVKLIFGTALIGLIAITTTSREVRARYTTVFSDGVPQLSATSEVAKAQGSTIARKNLLRASVILTLQNPLVGVGPGMFSVAAADDPFVAKVLFAAWKETHNTFSQVSSETGIPGLLIYLCIVVPVFTTLLRVWRRSRKRKEFELHAHLAHCLMLMLMIFIVGAMFGSSAYNFFLPTLAGLTAALGNVMRREELLSLPRRLRGRLGCWIGAGL